MEWTPNAAVQKVKRMADVMHETAKAILEQKRQEIREGPEGVEGEKDIISVLRKSLLFWWRLAVYLTYLMTKSVRMKEQVLMKSLARRN